MSNGGNLNLKLRDIGMNQKSKELALEPERSEKEAARILGCAPATLKKSRVTGRLFGVAAPRFKKKGKKVTYTDSVISEFNSQFELHANTAEYAGTA